MKDPEGYLSGESLPLAFGNAALRVSARVDVEESGRNLPWREIEEYALAYVELHLGDVPRLEYERELLCALVVRAAREERHSEVVELMRGLAYLVGRFPHEEGERLLSLGIQACQHLRDRRRLA